MDIAVYRTMLARPGAPALSLWSLLGRLAFTMTNLSLLLYVNAATGSLALAGACAATNLVGIALAATVQGRWFDRHGVTRTLCALTAAYLPLTALIVVLVEDVRSPGWLLVVILAQSLCTPLINVASRAMLPHLAPWLAPDADARQALFLYWTISLEVCYVAAPALAGLLGAALSADAPYLTSAVVLATASVGYSLLPAIRGHRGTAEKPHLPAPAHSRAGLRTVVIAALAFGTVVGFVVITTTAIATSQGRADWVGPLFAVMTVCSVLSALVFGAGGGPRRRAVQLPALIAVGGLALLIPLAGDHMLLLAVTVMVAGATFAPQMTLQSLILDDVVADHRSGAGFGWITTAIAAGNGAGQALGGFLAESGSPGLASVVGAAVVLAGAAAVALRRDSLVPDDGEHTHEAERTAQETWDWLTTVGGP